MIEIRHSKPLAESLKSTLEKAWAAAVDNPAGGFTRISDLEPEWKAAEDLARSVKPAKKTLVIGIGGSSLGAQVIHQALRPQAGVHFLAAPDPDVWSGLKGFIGPDWRDKNIVIVSKSGNTLETLAWVEQIAANEPAWLKTSQVTVVASPGQGALQKWAAKNKIPTLWIPENVGGRFSVLSAAGMFPAALMGLNLKEFRAGSAWALKRVDLASQLSHELLGAFERGEWIAQMWTYSEYLGLFGDWWVQLVSESLGKRFTRDGKIAPRVSTPMACRGPRDQHSLVQQLMDGAKDKYVFVTRVRAVEAAAQSLRPSLFPEMPFHNRNVSLGKVLGAEAQAFEKSLMDCGVSFSAVSIESISERSLGALFMLWQMSIAQIGEVLGIDVFNQPGVELGKKHATQLILQ